MRSRVVLGALAAFAVLAAILWIPWATDKRPIIASTPVPPPVFGVTPAAVPAGATACMTNVTFYERTQIAEIGVTTKGRGPALDITASASGYRSTARVPGGYTSNPALRFTLTPPGKPVLGRLCIRNTGRSAISLNGTEELSTMGRPSLVINGAAQPMDAKLVFYDKRRVSYASRLSEIFRHAALFTPPFLSAAVLILLGLIALVGIPVAMAKALAVAWSEDD
jgi:hypothetical protein